MTDEPPVPVEQRPAGQLTVHQLLTLAHEKIEGLTREGLRLGVSSEQMMASTAGATISAARNHDYTLAKNAITEAKLRVTRALERSHGILRDLDLEQPRLLKLAKRAYADATEDDES